MAKPNLKSIKKIKIVPNSWKEHHHFDLIVAIIITSLIIIVIQVLQNPHRVNAGNVYCAITCSSDINTLGENDDVIIDGGEPVVISGHHKFKSLTIKNNGTLTHGAFINKINPDGTISQDNKDNIVDLEIVESLILESGGSINVEGKGYQPRAFPTSLPHQSTYQALDGFGPKDTVGKGEATTLTAGGGGSIGKGGDDPVGNRTDSIYAKGGKGQVQTADLLVGSSGGTTYMAWFNAVWAGGIGGAGGGRIRIKAKNIEFQSTESKISANGQTSKCTGNPCIANGMDGGGGGGGSIDITVTERFEYLYSSLTPASISKGSARANDRSRLYNFNPHQDATDGDKLTGGKTFFNISANGGSGLTEGNQKNVGGGGGGGYIKIVSPAYVKNLCNIGLGVDKISASCEGKDVVITDGATVYADKVGVYQREVKNVLGVITQPKGGGCDLSSGDTNCDTKRHLSSLTIEAGANLTHQAVTVADMVGKESGSIASTSPKKVDLIIDGDLMLDTGGKINVDAKGYPGSYMNQECDGDPSPPNDPIGAGLDKIIGFGPGGGKGKVDADVGRMNTGYGAGGGYAGAGGQGFQEGSPFSGGAAYDYNVGYGATIDFGSGGGLAWDYGERKGAKEEESCYIGGSGGGRIILDVGGSIKFNESDSEISANGGNAFESKAEDNDISAGGGSGGAIKIQAQNIDGSSGYLARYYGGTQDSEPGIFQTSGFAEDALFYQLSAIGGDYNGYNTANGGGGGGGWIILNGHGARITVNLLKNSSPYSAPSAGTVTLSSGEDNCTPTSSKNGTGTISSFLFGGLLGDSANHCTYMAIYNEGIYSGSGSVTIFDPADVKNINLNVYPDSLIAGDVHASVNMNLNNFKLEDKAIAVIGNNTITKADCKTINPSDQCKKLLNYTINPTLFNPNTFLSQINKLQSEKAEALVSSTANLNSKNEPEGGVWKTTGDLKLSGYGSISCTGTGNESGTIIVNGKLTVDSNNFGNCGTTANKIGLIVLGNVVFTSTITNFNAAIYSTGTIDLSVATGINFKGILVANGNITLPNYGQFTYDSKYAKTPILPGFAKLISIVQSTIAP